MTKDATTKRWRCLATGCNPVLSEATAPAHHYESGHRVAKWPVRSAAGIKLARQRNRTGYYDKYNTGAKSAAARGIGSNGRPRDLVDRINDEIHPFSDEAFG